jgi:hypothetical protein
MKEIIKSQIRRHNVFIFIMLLFLSFTSCSQEEIRIKLETVNQSPQVHHAMNKLSKLNFIRFVEQNPDYIIHARMNEENYEPEAYRIIVRTNMCELKQAILQD